MRQKRKESTVRVLGCISQREIDIEMERDRDHKVRNPEHDSVRKYQPGKRGRRAGVEPVRGRSTEADTCGSCEYLGYSYTKKFLVVYLKFRFN